MQATTLYKVTITDALKGPTPHGFSFGSSSGNDKIRIFGGDAHVYNHMPHKKSKFANRETLGTYFGMRNSLHRVYFSKSENVVKLTNVVFDETLYPLATKMSHNDDDTYANDNRNDPITDSNNGTVQLVISHREVRTTNQRIVPHGDGPANMISINHNEPHDTRRNSQLAKKKKRSVWR